ncbi:MAG: hypothetical protein K9K66_14080 [Desulfarculaceae bacterium]|nr:hypothetical protein [Desulfarculaceae bacterium]MCF8074200.1 hypothetical protein [Desulfarculaceae bacterium]MCF8102781.1 hypothetical protein [Desulfarculaceae bacterium]MCF8116364.1 hypothetical protein [Desulfarculaceae bacterium]
MLSAIMGPFDERKRDLQAASDQMKKGWGMLSEYKNKMFGQDKQQAYQALLNAQDNLNSKWDDYKRARKKAFEQHQREWENKHRAWEERVRKNIDKLEERRSRLEGVLEHKKSHLRELHRKLDDAWSDDFRDRVSGWIDEEESSVQDIMDKLSQTEARIIHTASPLTPPRAVP